jgi:enolase-phosphatase E1
LKPATQSFSCVLLDIEGTTTSISFVYDVLFPYARQHAREFLMRHGDSVSVQEIVAALRRQHEGDEKLGLAPPPLNVAADKWAPELLYINWLMDRDSKAAPLKALQGLIWKEGYDDGQLKGHVFPDVPRAFQRWRANSVSIAIFSSGSVVAQKQLFANSEAGDLTGYIAAYFDTGTGPKREAESYRAIAREMQRPPADILFVSDVPEELDAASAASMGVFLCIRPGNPTAAKAAHPSLHSFDEVA